MQSSHILYQKNYQLFCIRIKAHKSLGYKKLFYLIHNGFNKIKIRKRSSKLSKKFTIGIFSRYHKVKNHEYLFRTLGVLKKKNYDFKLLLLGPNINTKIINLF